MPRLRCCCNSTRALKTTTAARYCCGCLIPRPAKPASDQRYRLLEWRLSSGEKHRWSSTWIRRPWTIARQLDPSTPTPDRLANDTIPVTASLLLLKFRACPRAARLSPYTRRRHKAVTHKKSRLSFDHCAVLGLQGEVKTNIEPYVPMVDKTRISDVRWW